MFHAAKAVLLAVDSEPHTHSGVISQFSLHFVKTGQIEQLYGRVLSTAMQARETGDYNPMRRASQLQAEQTIVDAEKFVARVKLLLNDLLPAERT